MRRRRKKKKQRRKHIYIERERLLASAQTISRYSVFKHVNVRGSGGNIPVQSVLEKPEFFLFLFAPGESYNRLFAHTRQLIMVFVSQGWRLVVSSRYVYNQNEVWLINILDIMCFLCNESILCLPVMV